MDVISTSQSLSVHTEYGMDTKFTVSLFVCLFICLSFFVQLWFSLPGLNRSVWNCYFASTN